MPKSTFFNLSEEKRQRIINATIDEFIENSYENVTISNIAKRSSIPVGSFYQYFYDKDDLYLYLFFEIDIRILEICENEKLTYIDIKENNKIDIYKYVTPKELAFYDTWYFVPNDVMRKYYFGEYDNRVFDLCRQKIEQYRDEGRLIDTVDINFILYFYVTSTFNVYMYCKKNNIDDEKKRLELKIQFFEEVLSNGIFKKPNKN